MIGHGHGTRCTITSASTITGHVHAAVYGHYVRAPPMRVSLLRPSASAPSACPSAHAQRLEQQQDRGQNQRRQREEEKAEQIWATRALPVRPLLRAATATHIHACTSQPGPHAASRAQQSTAERSGGPALHAQEQPENHAFVGASKQGARDVVKGVHGPHVVDRATSARGSDHYFHHLPTTSAARRRVVSAETAVVSAETAVVSAEPAALSAAAA